MISGPLTMKKKAPVSLAIALAMSVLPQPGGPKSKTPFGGLTPRTLNNCGCLNGSSIISLILAICYPQPPMSSYPIPSAASSSSLLIGSPSVNKIVWSVTIPQSGGSTSTTLNSTGLNEPLTTKVSPFLIGLNEFLKYGTK